MRHIAVIGAGAIGQLIAEELTDRGHRVSLVSRSGSTRAAGVRSVAADATDPRALAEALGPTGASGGYHDVVVNAVNPRSYTAWERDWPPMSEAISAVCERTGAGQLIIGNLYGYGRVDEPMTENHPFSPEGPKGRVRAQMWERALQKHREGAMAAVELRASDYFGPTARAGVSLLMDYVVRPVLKGRTAWVPMGDLRAAHSWSYLPDIARLAADLAESDQGGPRWGRPWHVPTAPPRSMREVADEVAELAGLDRAVVRKVPGIVMAAGRLHPLVRALDETKHQVEHPWILDSGAAQREFGRQPTSWSQALLETIDGCAEGRDAGRKN